MTWKPTIQQNLNISISSMPSPPAVPVLSLPVPSANSHSIPTARSTGSQGLFDTKLVESCVPDVVVVCVNSSSSFSSLTVWGCLLMMTSLSHLPLRFYRVHTNHNHENGTQLSTSLVSNSPWDPVDLAVGMLWEWDCWGYRERQNGNSRWRRHWRDWYVEILLDSWLSGHARACTTCTQGPWTPTMSASVREKPRWHTEQVAMLLIENKLVEKAARWGVVHTESEYN